MRVLVACEYTATVRDAFRNRGHDAWSCDLLPTTGDPSFHIEGDVTRHLNEGWDLMIAHPPCTHLTKLRAPHGGYGSEDNLEQMMGIAFVYQLWNAPIPKVCVENPVGILSSVWRKPDQYIHPHEFGHPYTKKTCLWLRGVPRLKPTKMVIPESPWVEGGSRLVARGYTPKVDRDKTFTGWAEAMAEQWGGVLSCPAHG